MRVQFKPYGVEEGFTWADVEAGIRTVLETGRHGGAYWLVGGHYDTEVEGIAFTVTRNGIKLLPLTGPLSIEKAQQAERTNAANTFPATVTGYVRAILTLNGL